MSMRKLKFHEQKLLKKTNFLEYKKEKKFHDISVIRRFHIEHKEDYYKYNKICGLVTSLVTKLKAMKPNSPYRQKTTEQLLEKLYNMGLIPKQGSLVDCEKLGASRFCRRRLPVVMVSLRMSQNLTEAITLIETGQVRVGPEIVTDPAFLVTRNNEDYVTWIDSSKIREHLQDFKEEHDDYELLGL